jgi:hypothetical protein
MHSGWRIACPPRLKRQKGWLKLLVSSPNLLTKKKPNSSFRIAVENLSRRCLFRRSRNWNRRHTLTFVNEDSYHLSFYGYLCNVCFYNRELQEYRIYLDPKNIYEDLRKAVGDDRMPFTFDELLTWAWPLVMVVDHRNKTHEMMKVLQNEWEAKGLVKIAPFHQSLGSKRRRRRSRHQRREARKRHSTNEWRT